jgi:hypothetical protein
VETHGEFLLLCIGLAIPLCWVSARFYLSFFLPSGRDSSESGVPSRRENTSGSCSDRCWCPFFWFGLAAAAEKRQARCKNSFLDNKRTLAALFAFSWGISFVATRLPELGQLFLSLQGAAEGQNPLTAALVRAYEIAWNGHNPIPCSSFWV